MLCHRDESIKTNDENFWTEAYSLNCSSTAGYASVLYFVVFFLLSCYFCVICLFFYTLILLSRLQKCIAGYLAGLS